MAAPVIDENAQKFLDGGQYTATGIRKYEWMFGETFVSNGGLESTKERFARVPIKQGDRVLDVGSGLGGTAFYLAEAFGCHVEGYDLSKNMVQRAHEYLEQRKHLKDLVSFTQADVTKTQFPENYFDIVQSSGVILHIKDKASLFEQFFRALKPGGRILLSEYVIETETPSDDFRSDISKKQYYLPTGTGYEELLRKAGFTKILGENHQQRLLESHERELQRLDLVKSEFLKEFSQEDYNGLKSAWEAKIKRIKSGDLGWRWLLAEKPAQ